MCTGVTYVVCGDSVIGSEVRLNSGIVDRTASLAQSDL